MNQLEVPPDEAAIAVAFSLLGCVLFGVWQHSYVACLSLFLFCIAVFMIVVKRNPR